MSSPEIASHPSVEPVEDPAPTADLATVKKTDADSTLSIDESLRKEIASIGTESKVQSAATPTIEGREPSRAPRTIDTVTTERRDDLKKLVDLRAEIAQSSTQQKEESAAQQFDPLNAAGLGKLNLVNPSYQQEKTMSDRQLESIQIADKLKKNPSERPDNKFQSFLKRIFKP